MTSLPPPCARLGAAALLTLLLAGCSGAPAVRPAEEKAAPAATAQAPAAPAEAEIDPRTLSDYSMAVNTYKAGNRKTAESIFQNIAKAHPELPGPHANLGMIYYDRGETGRAEEEFNLALKLKPDLPEIYNIRGIIHRNRGEFDKALQNYEAGLKIAPNNPNLLLNLGILHDLYLNQPQKALQLWVNYKKIVGEDKLVDSWIADITKRMTTK